MHVIKVKQTKVGKTQKVTIINKLITVNISTHGYVSITKQRFSRAQMLRRISWRRVGGGLSTSIGGPNNKSSWLRTGGGLSTSIGGPNNKPSWTSTGGDLGVGVGEGGGDLDVGLGLGGDMIDRMCERESEFQLVGWWIFSGCICCCYEQTCLLMRFWGALLLPMQHATCDAS